MPVRPAASVDPWDGAWLNVTATGATRSGYLTVWSGAEARPLASTLNYGAGSTVPNLAAVALSTSGTVAIHNGSTGSVHVVVDVVARLGSGASVAPGSVTAVTPFRALDTRARGVRLAPGSSVDVPVTGRGGVPATASGVALNVTAVSPESAGWATVHSPASPRHWASSMTWSRGGTRATAVLSNVANGQVRVHNGSTAAVHVIVDVTGWVAPGSTEFRPTALTLTSPRRLIDTRGGAPVKPGTDLTLPDGDLASLHSPVYTVTTTGGTGPGYLSVPGTASSLANYATGTTSSSLTTVMIGRAGDLPQLRNHGSSVHVVVDLVGWIGPDTWVAGRVLDDSGAPIPVAQVAMAEPSASPGRHQGNLSRSIADAQGRWVLHDAPTEPVPLCAVHRPTMWSDGAQNHSPACLGGSVINPATFDFPKGTRALGIDLTLPAGGAITSFFVAQPDAFIFPYVLVRNVDTGRQSLVFMGSGRRNGRITVTSLEPGSYLVLRHDTSETHEFAWVGGIQAGMMSTPDLLRLGATPVTVTAGLVTDLGTYSPLLGGRIGVTTRSTSTFDFAVYTADGRMMFRRGVNSSALVDQGGLRPGTYYLCTAPVGRAMACDSPDDGTGPLTVTADHVTVIEVPAP
ncbi:hypothetical protein Q9R29_17090 [Rothia sp. ARF10]|nr:hypothetical protein [Rothia sp. ARF10]